MSSEEPKVTHLPTFTREMALLQMPDLEWKGKASSWRLPSREGKNVKAQNSIAANYDYSFQGSNY